MIEQKDWIVQTYLRDPHSYAWGDKCPTCSEPMDYDSGETGIPPCVYCPNCETEHPVAHNMDDQAPAATRTECLSA